MGKSAKKKPRLTKANPKAQERQEEEPKFDPSPIFPSSDDEADDDLSLKIVEKAMSRAGNNNTNSNPSSSSLEPEIIITEVKKKMKAAKERKNENIGAQDNAIEDVETNVEGSEPKETDVTLEINPLEKSDNIVLQKLQPKEADATLDTNPLEKSDNVVLRKLLRGPRYFDPPDSSWGNCYNCGEGGHTAANCRSAKRKKPCFVCGSLEHNVKQCKQGKDCFICKKGGHRAKDCPEKSVGGSQKAKICLKCGDSGHDMFSCKSMYSPDDLKEIQCYVCKCFGHLCCVNCASPGPREVSCYRCGQLGHTGLDCARVRAETTSTGSPSSCYKCGEVGHMARKCTISAKKDKRKREFSSPKRTHSRDNYGNHIGVRSMPHDLGNARKRNKTQTQYGQPSSSESKRRGRGGWITDDPGDFDHGNYNANGWRSPKTPARYKSNSRFHGGDGYGSGFHSNGRKFQYESAVGSNGYQHRFSASKYGNSSSYGKREYGWDY